MTDFADANTAPQRRLPPPVASLMRLHDAFFGRLEDVLAGWFNGLAARFVFASLLLFYYLNSGLAKLGDGVSGIFNPSPGAYGVILPPVFEAYGADVGAIPFYWDAIVLFGTWAEIVLPILVVVGLFGRIAAIGTIIFIAVQSFVDVAFHGLEGRFVGAMFDRFPDAIVFDQRLLWVFVLLMIVVNGPGKLSLDHILARRYR